MVVEWVDCHRSQIFTIALGFNFYSEKVTIFTCSEISVSEGNKRFLASPETEKPFSDCLYVFNR